MMPTGGFSFDMFNYFSDYGRSRAGRRERITYNKQQLDQLEAVFKSTRYPDVYKREELSKYLGIPEVRIQVWFKNRRARQRQNDRTLSIVKSHNRNSIESPPPPPPTSTSLTEQVSSDSNCDNFKIIKPEFEMLKPESPEMHPKQKTLLPPPQQNYQNYSNSMSWWQANFMSPNNFSTYGFTHQPGTSSAMLAAATAATASFLDPPSLMANSLRANANAFRNDIPRSTKRERTKFDERQLAHMENFFSTKQYPDGNDREIMARQLQLTETKVQIWFKNRRAKDRCQKNIENMLKCKDIGERKRNHDDDNNSSLRKIKKIETPPPEPGSKEPKIELPETSSDYIPIYNPEWDDKNDIKTFGNYNEKDFKFGNYNFNFDPTTSFNTTTTNETLLQQNATMAATNQLSWMPPNYNPYSFGYFPTNYYGQNPVNSTTMNQMPGYNDFYANQHGQIPSLKDKF